MQLWTVLFAALTGKALAQVINAKSYTGWDCCKPLCSHFNNNNQARNAQNSHGLPAVCAADGSRSWSGLEGSARTSGCTASGPAAADAGYSCTSYIPRALNETHSVGFAIQVGGQQDGTNPNCCKCFDMEWRSGAARGKHMILQTITPGQTGGSVRQNDMIIMIPGGGVGPEQTGCTNQWGSRYRWGDRYGGLSNRTGCEGLPDDLVGGCYWRFNWARGEVNNWDVTYRPISCPYEITSVSGCSA